MNLIDLMSLTQCKACDTVLRGEINICPDCGASKNQDSLSDKKDNLQKKVKVKPKTNSEHISIRMDVLDHIISDLNNIAELQKIFGEPVAKGLVIIADNNDLRIEDAGLKELTPEDSEKFLGILDEVVRTNSL